MIREIYKKVVLLLVLGLFVVLPASSHAQGDTLSEGSLAISPFLIETTLKPGQSEVNTITVSNRSDTPLPIAISVNDFIPAGDHGGVRFLDTGQAAHPNFSLASWITITSQPDFTIPPRGQTKVTFSISVPIDAEPGTHYGGLLFSAREKDNEQLNVAVIKKIGTIILVGAGTTNASGEIRSFDSTKNFYSEPQVNFSTDFANTGNVHLQPKGQIAIRNIFGQLIGEAYINQDAQFVLPGTLRGFEGAFKRNWLLGRYTAELTMYYGNPKLEARASVHFWVIPTRQILLYGGLLILVIGVCYVSITQYNAWVIRKNTK